MGGKGGAISSFLAHSPSAHCLSQTKVLFSELLKGFFVKRVRGDPSSLFLHRDAMPVRWAKMSGGKRFCEVDG